MLLIWLGVYCVLGPWVLRLLAVDFGNPRHFRVSPDVLEDVQFVMWTYALSLIAVVLLGWGISRRAQLDYSTTARAMVLGGLPVFAVWWLLRLALWEIYRSGLEQADGAGVGNHIRAAFFGTVGYWVVVILPVETLRYFSVKLVIGNQITGKKIAVGTLIGAGFQLLANLENSKISCLEDQSSVMPSFPISFSAIKLLQPQYVLYGALHGYGLAIGQRWPLWTALGVEIIFITGSGLVSCLVCAFSWAAVCWCVWSRCLVV